MLNEYRQCVYKPVNVAAYFCHVFKSLNNNNNEISYTLFLRKVCFSTSVSYADDDLTLWVINMVHGIAPL